MNNSGIVRIGMIGLGPRAETLLATLFLMQSEVTAICDLSTEKCDKILSLLDSKNKPKPAVYQDYRKLLSSKEVDVVIVTTSWNTHLPIAYDAMCAGKFVGIEVGGAPSLEELWRLVYAWESTKTPCMMLENSCFGRNIMMVTRMVRLGLFGELIHCQCGYEHYIADRLVGEFDRGIERVFHNVCRNGDLYPTHGLGPIAKILQINRGNRFLTLTSTASKARGFAEAAQKRGDSRIFNEGDIITTVIKCANGETIVVTHSISLPRPHSLSRRVQGTRGIWIEEAKSMYIEGISPHFQNIDIAGNPYFVHKWSSIDDFYEEYEHPTWRDFRNNPVGGHGGSDTLVLRAFLNAAEKKEEPPIDVYDIAAWMAVTILSEQSIALGSAPVAFPDFTNGKWIRREPDLSID
ncbi:MAG: Gfo/Idh/MocA family oxidoreductase [Candidatus Ratteibacteria bacterium]